MKTYNIKECYALLGYKTKKALQAQLNRDAQHYPTDLSKRKYPNAYKCPCGAARGGWLIPDYEVNNFINEQTTRQLVGAKTNKDIEALIKKHKKTNQISS